MPEGVSLNEHAVDLRDRVLARGHGTHHPGSHLQRNPPGTYDRLRFKPGSVLLLPSSGWYAVGCLATGEQRRAEEVLTTLAGLQYEAPGEPFDGTFPIFAGFPHPPTGGQARMWEEYDPNWRQFLGCMLELVLLRAGSDGPVGLPAIDDVLAERLGSVSARAAASDPDDRVPPGYTNIALMRAWHDVTVGRRTQQAALVERGDSMRAQVLGRWRAHHAFDEFNSPTYYGVLLLALGLWVDHAPTEEFSRDGRRLLAGLVEEIATTYHPRLRNLCGPYFRAYGLDMTQYVAALGLWLTAAGVRPAPLPDLGAEELHQGHDLQLAATIPLFPTVTAELAVALQAASALPRAFSRELADERQVAGHLGPEAMFGVESSPHDWDAWVQFTGATGHWAAGEETAWFVLRARGAMAGRPRADGLDLRLADDTRGAWLELSTTVHELARGHLDLGDAGHLVVADTEIAGVAPDGRVLLDRPSGAAVSLTLRR